MPRVRLLQIKLHSSSVQFADYRQSLNELSGTFEDMVLVTTDLFILSGLNYKHLTVCKAYLLDFQLFSIHFETLRMLLVHTASTVFVLM